MSEFKLDAVKISDMGNAVANVLREYGIVGGELSFDIDKENIKKINEDLFYRAYEHQEGDEPQETDEITINFDNGFRVVFREREA